MYQKPLLPKVKGGFWGIPLETEASVRNRRNLFTSSTSSAALQNSFAGWELYECVDNVTCLGGEYVPSQTPKNIGSLLLTFNNKKKTPTESSSEINSAILPAELAASEINSANYPSADKDSAILMQGQGTSPAIVPLGGLSQNNLCALHRDPRSIACSRCAAGFKRSNAKNSGPCAACPADASAEVTNVIVVVAIVMFLVTASAAAVVTFMTRAMIARQDVRLDRILLEEEGHRSGQDQEKKDWEEEEKTKLGRGLDTQVDVTSLGGRRVDFCDDEGEEEREDEGRAHDSSDVKNRISNKEGTHQMSLRIAPRGEENLVQDFRRKQKIQEKLDHFNVRKKKVRKVVGETMKAGVEDCGDFLNFNFSDASIDVGDLHNFKFSSLFWNNTSGGPDSGGPGCCSMGEKSRPGAPSGPQSGPSSPGMCSKIFATAGFPALDLSLLFIICILFLKYLQTFSVMYSFALVIPEVNLWFFELPEILQIDFNWEVSVECTLTTLKPVLGAPK